LVHQRETQDAAALERGVEPDLLETLGLVDHWPEWLAALDSLDAVKTAA
jgi:hypothetical protein